MDGLRKTTKNVSQNSRCADRDLNLLSGLCSLVKDTEGVGSYGPGFTRTPQFISIYGSRDLCGTSVSSQFLDLLYSLQDALEGETARPKTATYTQDSINTV
jgi:hypothetical protein